MRRSSQYCKKSSLDGFFISPSEIDPEIVKPWVLTNQPQKITFVLLTIKFLIRIAESCLTSTALFSSANSLVKESKNFL